MSFRAHLAISAAPIVLRIALSMAALWFGFGMLASTVVVEEGARPALVAMGIEPLPADPAAPGVVIQRVYRTALSIHSAANPPFDDATGLRRAPLWPAWAATGEGPRAIAVSAMIAAMLSGVLVLLGLGTRFTAALFSVLVLASIWLEVCVPAIHAGGAMAGFLPNLAPFDREAWAPTAMLILLFTISLALLVCGPGRVSIDALLFRAPRASGG